jgi:hypothetical protein
MCSRHRSVSGLILLAMAATACAQPAPDSAETTKILDAIRGAVLAYTEKLPNFICVQLTVRDIAAAPNAPLGIKETGRGGPSSIRTTSGTWQRVDSYEQQLTYFQRRESYKLLKVNGKIPGPKQEAPPGATSTGEFGTTLSQIFDPESRAEFDWKRWDTVRGRHVSVFAFKVEKSRSLAELVTPVARAVVGYHGLVFADRETDAVLRVTTEAEAPLDFPLQDTTHRLDYGLVTIGGDQFMLPIEGEMQSRASQDFMEYGRLGGNSRQVLMRNRVDFKSYRRYAADADLKLDPDTK